MGVVHEDALAAELRRDAARVGEVEDAPGHVAHDAVVLALVDQVDAEQLVVLAAHVDGAGAVPLGDHVAVAGHDGVAHLVAKLDARGERDGKAAFDAGECVHRQLDLHALLDAAALVLGDELDHDGEGGVGIGAVEREPGLIVHDALVAGDVHG